MRVFVMFGGKSGEYEVSCRSAAAVLSHMDRKKYEVYKIGVTKNGEWFLTEADEKTIASGAWTDMPNKKAFLSPDTADHGFYVFDGEKPTLIKADVVFPVMHGDFGEDGCVQGLCALAGIPIVGPGVLASAAGMDKAVAKELFRAAGLPLADWIVLYKTDTDAAAKIRERFDYPVFIKPANAGSSLGAYKVLNEKELPAALQGAFAVDDKILAEEYIDAREIESAVLGNEDAAVSVLGEILPAAAFYDYDAKYKNADSKLLIPAPLDAKTTEKIRNYALLAFRAVGAKGLSRIDFFMEKSTGRVVLNEINTMPGFTSISMYPKLWEASGISFSALVDKLIELA